MKSKLQFLQEYIANNSIKCQQEACQLPKLGLCLNYNCSQDLNMFCYTCQLKKKNDSRHFLHYTIDIRTILQQQKLEFGLKDIQTFYQKIQSLLSKQWKENLQIVEKSCHQDKKSWVILNLQTQYDRTNKTLTQKMSQVRQTIKKNSNKFLESIYKILHSNLDASLLAKQLRDTQKQYQEFITSSKNFFSQILDDRNRYIQETQASNKIHKLLSTLNKYDKTKKLFNQMLEVAKFPLEMNSFSKKLWDQIPKAYLKIPNFIIDQYHQIYVNRSKSIFKQVEKMHISKLFTTYKLIRQQMIKIVND